MKIIFLLLTTYKSIWLGSFEAEWLDSSFPEVFFFVVVTFLFLVVMMNLLIAIMADTFTRVQQRATMENTRMRASLLYDLEYWVRTGRQPSIFSSFVQLISRVFPSLKEFFPSLRTFSSSSPSVSPQFVLFAQLDTHKVREKRKSLELKMRSDSVGVGRDIFAKSEDLAF